MWDLIEKRKILAGNNSPNPAVYQASSWLDIWPDWQGKLKKKIGFATALYPAGYSANFRPDCDVDHFSFRFRFRLPFH